jgi:hypothetical protein
MRWHPEPKDDAWRQAHLAMVEGLGKRSWLSCDQCQHWAMVEVTASLPGSMVSISGRRC